MPGHILCQHCKTITEYTEEDKKYVCNECKQVIIDFGKEDKMAVPVKEFEMPCDTCKEKTLWARFGSNGDGTHYYECTKCKKEIYMAEGYGEWPKEDDKDVKDDK
jgi:predicted SprT family Zn-dependent metalloprotease